MENKPIKINLSELLNTVEKRKKEKPLEESVIATDAFINEVTSKIYKEIE